MLRDYQNSFREADLMAQTAMANPLRSGAAFNALRSEFSPHAIAQGGTVTPLPSRTDRPRGETMPVGPLRTLEAQPVSASISGMTQMPNASRALAASRRFKDFLAVNPTASSGSAADLISAYKEWTGQQNWQGWQPSVAPTSAPPTSAFTAPSPIMSAAPAAPNHLQNFYETHGYYPGQGG